MTRKHNDVAKKREAILHASREKEHQRLQEQQSKNRKPSELDDLLTLVLQQWDCRALLHYMQHYFTRVLNHRDPLDFAASLFADTASIECGEGRELSFRLYCQEVCESASLFIGTTTTTVAPASEETPDSIEGQQHYIKLLRACFLLGLLYDSRIQQLVMGRHAINYECVRCRPPGRLKTNAFLGAIRPDCDAFLARELSLPLMCERALERWGSDEFALRRFSEQSFRYQEKNELNTMMTEENTPHNGHPQTRSTESRTGCDLSLIDELGY
jgi:hypothetical protein